MEDQKKVERNPKVNITTSLDFKMYDIARQYNISWQRALMIGICNELIDKDVWHETNLPTNEYYFLRKINELKEDKVKLMTELTELKDNLENGRKS